LYFIKFIIVFFIIFFKSEFYLLIRYGDILPDGRVIVKLASYPPTSTSHPSSSPPSSPLPSDAQSMLIAGAFLFTDGKDLNNNNSFFGSLNKKSKQAIAAEIYHMNEYDELNGWNLKTVDFMIMH
jgi:hypothetical protein